MDINLIIGIISLIICIIGIVIPKIYKLKIKRYIKKNWNNYNNYDLMYGDSKINCKESLYFLCLKEIQNEKNNNIPKSWF